jgi:uracil-DNA glycosylase
MNLELEKSWMNEIGEELSKPYFKSLMSFVKNEYETSICYPPEDRIFAAFQHCSFENTKLIIIGQDPYHGPKQANGLCFSVYDNQQMPPSLVNIFKGLKEDLGKPIPNSGNLEGWADQGVLLLNDVLTVRAKIPESHKGQGWEIFTDAVIQTLNERKSNLVFLLWGSKAEKKGKLIDTSKHLVLTSAHPSPLSVYRGFLENKHFSKANEFLISKNIKPIEW